MEARRSSPAPPLSAVTAGSQRSRVACTISFTFSPGMVLPELDHEVLSVASAGSTRRRRSSGRSRGSGRAACVGVGPKYGCARQRVERVDPEPVLRAGRTCRRLFAFQSARESVVIVKQPTCDLVADDPREQRDAPRRPARAAARGPADLPPEQVRARARAAGAAAACSRGSRARTTSAERGREPEGPARARERARGRTSPRRAAGRGSRGSTWTSCQTRYGLERRDHARRSARPTARGSGGRSRRRASAVATATSDLRRPDRPPVAAGDPVDRDQEPAVERLRDADGDAGDVAERAALDEDAARGCRDFSTNDGEDRAALVQRARSRAAARRPRRRSRRPRRRTHAATSAGRATST